MNGYWLILVNSAGCELDRQFCDPSGTRSTPGPVGDGVSARDAFASIDWDLSDGDTIRVEAGTRE